MYLSDLCTRGPHGTPRNLNVEATLRIFFSTESRVIVWLPASLPVTDCLPDSLEDAVAQRNSDMSNMVATYTE